MVSMVINGSFCIRKKMEEKFVSKRYIVISRMTSRGPEYRIYDQILECTLEGVFETQQWAESVAELMEDKWRSDKGRTCADFCRPSEHSEE